MALVNNIFELRSDAFKITVHHRRPIPVRTDTIGPWLEALTFLTWMSALTNSALVYMFSPTNGSAIVNLVKSIVPFEGLDGFISGVFNATTLTQDGVSMSGAQDASIKAAEHLVAASGNAGQEKWGLDGSSDLTYGATKDLLVKAALVALVASHVYLVVRALVRHVVEKVWWKGSVEVVEWEREDLIVKERFLNGGKGVLDGDDDDGSGRNFERNVREEVERMKGQEGGGDPVAMFWEHDEGVEEIQRIVKEA